MAALFIFLAIVVALGSADTFGPEAARAPPDLGEAPNGPDRRRVKVFGQPILT